MVETLADPLKQAMMNSYLNSLNDALWEKKITALTNEVIALADEITVQADEIALTNEIATLQRLLKQAGIEF